MDVPISRWFGGEYDLSAPRRADESGTER